MLLHSCASRPISTSKLFGGPTLLERYGAACLVTIDLVDQNSTAHELPDPLTFDQRVSNRETYP